MSGPMMLIPILFPILIALFMIPVPSKIKGVKETLVLIGTAVNLACAILLFGKDLTFVIPWGGFGIDFALRSYNFSWFITLAASALTFLVAVYSTVSLKGKVSAKPFFLYMLLTIAFVNGAVLANNLVVMLFFWEGLLVALFGMILAGGKESFATAVKAVVLVGVSDLCLMLGIGMTGFLAGTFAMDKINLPMDSGGIFAFTFMMIGAIAKAGSMPFHSWIPDAAKDAPLPFMALLPAALEKLLGIYLLTRISMNLFRLEPGSTMSIVMMTIGAVTILLAVMMALIQKDFKRLLSYHAISQVGYMILGIGTALPIGIAGGLFHMVNNAMYKSCLFLTGGAVERQTGTTDLAKLGGLGRKMPVTFICFLISAAAISGVPPFNGFFSKELVFDAALKSGAVFYVIALVGAFFTAASFLKLGHAAFLGKPSLATKKVSEAPKTMLAPMIVIAAGCALFGIWNVLPLKYLIEPILGNAVEGAGYSGFPNSAVLVTISIAVLILALLNHLFGFRRTGKGLAAADHIHYAPGLSKIYDWAERGYLDPYLIGMKLVKAVSLVFWRIDRGIDWVYETLAPNLAVGVAGLVKRPYNGNSRYNIAWSLGGIALILLIVWLNLK